MGRTTDQRTRLPSAVKGTTPAAFLRTGSAAFPDFCRLPHTPRQTNDHRRSTTTTYTSAIRNSSRSFAVHARESCIAGIFFTRRPFPFFNARKLNAEAFCRVIKRQNFEGTPIAFTTMCSLSHNADCLDEKMTPTTQRKTCSCASTVTKSLVILVRMITHRAIAFRVDCEKSIGRGMVLDYELTAKISVIMHHHFTAKGVVFPN